MSAPLHPSDSGLIQNHDRPAPPGWIKVVEICDAGPLVSYYPEGAG
jgi:hypothetical protein